MKKLISKGCFYQLIDNRKGIRISHGSVDIDRIAEEISEYQKTMEENQMTLTNDGTLTIEKGYTEQFIKLLIDQNIIETPKDVEITEENETVDVELSEIYGNLTDSLENLCERMENMRSLVLYFMSIPAMNMH